MITKREKILFEAINDLNNRLEEIESRFKINPHKRNEHNDWWIPIQRLALGIDDSKKSELNSQQEFDESKILPNVAPADIHSEINKEKLI
ncbi:MAG: hypothetical protein AABY22_11285 [Nanoarchaeota archaeon]